jgi:hypothetical protein
MFGISGWNQLCNQGATNISQEMVLTQDEWTRGVRYKIAISIQTGVLAWQWGSWPDLRIARHALVDAFDPGEYHIADGGYRDGGQWSVTPTG